jgi:hypothetical protein
VREAEIELVLQRRGDDGEPDRDRRERRLRADAAGKDRPAIPRARYSPNGLKRRVLVETSTALVSR